MSFVVKDLQVRDIENYRTRAEAVTGSTMREYYELEMDTCKGYSKEDIEALLAETLDEYKKALLQDLRPRGDGRAILRQVCPMTWTTQTYETAFGAIVKRKENCYDIVYMKAKQIREVNKNKLFAAGLDIAAKTVAAFALSGGAAAKLAGGSAAYNKVTKLAADLDQDMPNVVAGYIANEMITQRKLEIRNEEFYLTI